MDGKRAFDGVRRLALPISLCLGALLAPAGKANARDMILRLDPTADLNNSHRVVTVRGSLVCDSNQAFVVSAVLQQEDADMDVTGAGNTAPQVCTGQSQPFAVQVQASGLRNLSYRRGPATIMVADDVLPNGQQSAAHRDEKIITAELRLNEATTLTSEIRHDQVGTPDHVTFALRSARSPLHEDSDDSILIGAHYALAG